MYHSAEIATCALSVRLQKLNSSSHFPSAGTGLFYLFRAKLWQIPPCLMHLVNNFFHLISICVLSITSQSKGSAMLMHDRQRALAGSHVRYAHGGATSTFHSCCSPRLFHCLMYWCLSDWSRGNRGVSLLPLGQLMLPTMLEWPLCIFRYLPL